MFETQTIREIIAAAERAGVEPAALLAVAKVESGGRATARINDREEPLIRFEGHYFDRRLAGKKQAQARQLGLAAPKAGSVKNPAAQTERWRLLAGAVRIDRNAALESVSWGLGQVMGAHWQWLGYENVEALVAEARASVAGQIRLMLRFIEKSGLVEILNKHDWAGFARRYNGPLYRKFAYDQKMADAWKIYRDRLFLDSNIEEKASLLRTGARGEAVRELQSMLTSSGYPATPDGDFGPATTRAISQFQNDHGLKADGIAGPLTFSALERALPPASLVEHPLNGIFRLLSSAATILGFIKRSRIAGTAVDKITSRG